MFLGRRITRRGKGWVLIRLGLGNHLRDSLAEGLYRSDIVLHLTSHLVVRLLDDFFGLLLVSNDSFELLSHPHLIFFYGDVSIDFFFERRDNLGFAQVSAKVLVDLVEHLSRLKFATDVRAELVRHLFDLAKDVD